MIILNESVERAAKAGCERLKCVCKEPCGWCCCRALAAIAATASSNNCC